MLVGGLLALIGQTYQTGADPWQLFALWALLALPWCLGARSDMLWAPWALVAMTACVLWADAHARSAWWSPRDGALGYHLLAWAGGAAVVVAALAAEGVTEISHLENIDRGYEDIEGKLTRLGARVVRDGAARAREVV